MIDAAFFFKMKMEIGWAHLSKQVLITYIHVDAYAFIHKRCPVSEYVICKKSIYIICQSLQLDMLKAPLMGIFIVF